MRRPGLWVANGHPGDPSTMLSWKPGALTGFFDYVAINGMFQYKAANPDVPIVIMSGYTATELPDAFQQDERSAFLSKPFSFQELSDMLRALVDAPVRQPVAP